MISAVASWTGRRGRARPVGAAGPADAAVDAHPGQDVLEASPPVGREPRPPDAGDAPGRRVLAEEDAEEVGELAGVAAGPELVADVAAAGRGAAERRRTGCRRPPAAPADRARLIASQFAPSSSYCLRLAGSLRTALASLISLNLRSAAVSPGLASG